MNLLKNRYVFGSLLLMTIADVLNSFHVIWQNIGLKKSSFLPWEVFYDEQILATGENVLHAILFIGLLPAVLSWVLIYQKNSKLDNYVLPRVDRRKYLLEQGKRLFGFAAAYRIFLVLVELVNLQIQYGQLDFSLTFRQDGVAFGLFSRNAGLQLLLFTILSAIGWGIWTLFVYSVSLFVKRTIMIVPMSMLLSFGCTVLTVALADLKLPGIDSIFYGLFLANVQSPGELSFNGVDGPPLLYVCTSLGFYLLLSVFVFRLYISKAQRGELD